MQAISNSSVIISQNEIFHIEKNGVINNDIFSAISKETSSFIRSHVKWSNTASNSIENDTFLTLEINLAHETIKKFLDGHCESEEPNSLASYIYERTKQKYGASFSNNPRFGVAVYSQEQIDWRDTLCRNIAYNQPVSYVDLEKLIQLGFNKKTMNCIELSITSLYFFLLNNALSETEDLCLAQLDGHTVVVARSSDKLRVYDLFFDYLINPSNSPYSENWVPLEEEKYRSLLKKYQKEVSKYIYDSEHDFVFLENTTKEVKNMFILSKEISCFDKKLEAQLRHEFSKICLKNFSYNIKEINALIGCINDKNLNLALRKSCVSSDYIEITKLLLSQPYVNINDCGPSKMTAKMIAEKYNNTEAFKYISQIKDDNIISYKDYI